MSAARTDSPPLPRSCRTISTFSRYTIADGDRVAACVGVPDVTTGVLTHFIEQFTIKDGKIIENRLFHHNAGTLVDKLKVV